MQQTLASKLDETKKFFFFADSDLASLLRV